jgi:predicted nucleic acid-binding protein
MPIIISNASPLIGLVGIEQLHILKRLWSEIIIPEAVYKEVVIKGKGKQRVNEIEKACKEWIKVVSVKNRAEVEALQTILDEGEAEVISLGQEIKADLLILDNREPRNFARTVNLKVIGTIGVIRFAWLKGLIIEPIHEINKLCLNGFWIGEKLIKQIKEDFKNKIT